MTEAKATAPKTLPAPFWDKKAVEFQRANYQIVIPAMHTADDVLHPKYWGAFRDVLRKNDLIDCLAEDESFESQLRVVRVGRDVDVGSIWVRELRRWTNEKIVQEVVAAETGEIPEVPEGYKVNKGPGGKWRVVLIADGTTLASNMKTEYEAVTWAIRNANPEA